MASAYRPISKNCSASLFTASMFRFSVSLGRGISVCSTSNVRFLLSSIFSKYENSIEYFPGKDL